jgi:predicted HTH transcriptional regulator
LRIQQSKYIPNLIAQGEHQQLDFKYEINDARKIAKTLVAFANTDGGRLLIGVKDNGRIAGIRSDEEFYMVQSAAELYCKPFINFVSTRHIVEGRTVLEVWVEKNNTPCYAKDYENSWIAYVRVKDQNIRANRILIDVWKRRSEIRGTFIEYSKYEKALIEFLEHNPPATLSNIMRVLHITHRQAQQILINLISLDVIEMQLNEKEAQYLLKNPDSIS